MSEEISDQGLSRDALWTMAWMLGLASGLILLVFGIGGVNGGLDDQVWLVIAVICAVFSVGCMVLVGVKEAEARIAVRLRPPAE